jgi:hypothetical protein
VTWTPAHVTMRLTGNETGRSIIEPGKPNAKVALDANRIRFETLFVKSFQAR